MYAAPILLLISILAFDRFDTSAPTITNGPGDTRDNSQTGKYGQLPGSTSTALSLSVYPIFNPATQGSSSRLSQDDIARIVATVGVHFQLQTLSSSHQVNPVSSSAGVSSIAATSSATVTVSNSSKNLYRV